MTTYSNGWGHLIVTIVVLSMSTFLLYTNKVDTTAIMGLLGTVVAFWFLSGSSKFQQPVTDIPLPNLTPHTVDPQATQPKLPIPGQGGTNG